MPAQKNVGKWIVLGLFASGMAAGAAAVVWIERTPILAWYYVRSLARATDQDRAACAERVAGLGVEGEPAVFAILNQGDATACRNVASALGRWVDRWAADDPRAAGLAERMAVGFGACGAPGRLAVLESAAGWFRADKTKPSQALLSSCARLVAETAETQEPDAHAAGLNLCSLALDRLDDPQEMLPAGRDLVKRSLRDDDPAARLCAIRTAMHPGMNASEDVARLLRDPEPRVRRAALLAVGSEKESVVPAKSLLPVLHDPDPDVRRACEEVLRKGRGLTSQSFKIGWCLYHPDPAQRLNVLDCLRAGADVEPGAWLRELSHDDSPAVRLAAARAMSQQKVVDLSDRLEQMADGDPSPTVSQITRLYQKWGKSAARDGER